MNCPENRVRLHLLSVGASYGLLVLVFQHGWRAEQLGFTESPIIQAWIPLFLFAVIFGLSMDYHVFLLSRIRERYDQTGDNSESVAFGVRSTAGLITGAALIMVAVFLGFTAGELVPFQQMGFGLAVAVFLDATIVRVVLVPASMQLLGDANWYLPSFLAVAAGRARRGRLGRPGRRRRRFAPVASARELGLAWVGPRGDGSSSWPGPRVRTPSEAVVPRATASACADHGDAVGWRRCVW